LLSTLKELIIVAPPSTGAFELKTWPRLFPIPHGRMFLLQAVLRPLAAQALSKPLAI